MDAETRAVLENIARDVREVRRILLGDGQPEEGLIVRLEQLRMGMNTMPCQNHHQRLNHLEKCINRALMIYGGIAVGLGVLANAPNIIGILRKLL